MATQYEIEHNVEFAEKQRSSRRVDMASFFSLLNTLSNRSSLDPNAAPTPNLAEQHHRPHAVPTPVDTAALFRMVQDQFTTLSATAPTPDNREFLQQLVDALSHDIEDPPTTLQGVSEEFVAGLDRVGKKRLRKDDDCAICKVPYLEDEFPLVVELPCKGAHTFDLECVGPWLRSKGTCPMCRQEMGKKKEVPPPDSDEEDGDMMYA